jgi:hypothetical protein
VTSNPNPVADAWPHGGGWQPLGYVNQEDEKGGRNINTQAFSAEILRAVGWEPCSPEWLDTHPNECGSAPRWSDRQGDQLQAPEGGEMISHWHPQITRAQVVREEAIFLREIGTPTHGERTEHERGIMYAAERLNQRAALWVTHGQ